MSQSSLTLPEDQLSWGELNKSHIEFVKEKSTRNKENEKSDLNKLTENCSDKKTIQRTNTEASFIKSIEGSPEKELTIATKLKKLNHQDSQFECGVTKMTSQEQLKAKIDKIQSNGIFEKKQERIDVCGSSPLFENEYLQDIPKGKGMGLDKVKIEIESLSKSEIPKSKPVEDEEQSVDMDQLDIINLSHNTDMRNEKEEKDESFSRLGLGPVFSKKMLGLKEENDKLKQHIKELQMCMSQDKLNRENTEEKVLLSALQEILKTNQEEEETKKSSDGDKKGKAEPMSFEREGNGIIFIEDDIQQKKDTSMEMKKSISIIGLCEGQEMDDEEIVINDVAEEMEQKSEKKEEESNNMAAYASDNSFIEYNTYHKFKETLSPILENFDNEYSSGDTVVSQKESQIIFVERALGSIKIQTPKTSAENSKGSTGEKETEKLMKDIELCYSPHDIKVTAFNEEERVDRFSKKSQKTISSMGDLIESVKKQNENLTRLMRKKDDEIKILQKSNESLRAKLANLEGEKEQGFEKLQKEIGLKNRELKNLRDFARRKQSITDHIYSAREKFRESEINGDELEYLKSKVSKQNFTIEKLKKFNADLEREKLLTSNQLESTLFELKELNRYRILNDKDNFQIRFEIESATKLQSTNSILSSIKNIICMINNSLKFSLKSEDNSRGYKRKLEMKIYENEKLTKKVKKYEKKMDQLSFNYEDAINRFEVELSSQRGTYENKVKALREGIENLKNLLSVVNSTCLQTVKRSLSEEFCHIVEKLIRKETEISKSSRGLSSNQMKKRLKEIEDCMGRCYPLESEYEFDYEYEYKKRFRKRRGEFDDERY